MWAIEEELLASIYNLPHHKHNILQDEKSCLALANLLSSFCIIKDGEKGVCASWRQKGGDTALKHAALVLRDSDRNIKWFPEYGCAILEEHGIGCTAETVALNTVCLDAHAFQMHGSQRSCKYDHISTAKDCEILHVGTISSSELKEFYVRFQKIFSKAISRSGDQRSARGGKQGHQRTPAFIHALQRQAIACGCPMQSECHCPPQAPRGGFTDVGLHTGGSGRSTAWPLVCSVFHHALIQNLGRSFDKIQPTVLFQISMAYFDLFIAQSLSVPSTALTEGTTSSAPGSIIDSAHYILSSAAIKASVLSDDGHNMDNILRRISEVMCQLEERACSKSKAYAHKFSFPALGKELQEKHGHRGPELDIPSIVKASSTKPSLGVQRMRENIDWFPALNASTLEAIATWLKLPELKSATRGFIAVYILRTIESFMWQCAKEKLGNNCFQKDDLPILAMVVDRYRIVLHGLQEKKEWAAFMQVEMQSREVLVVWVAFCLIHNTTMKKYPRIMRNFGVPLEFKDLRHLVLSDRRASDTVLAIADFLQSHSHSSQKIFSLQNEKPTFAMAERYARAHLKDIWNQEHRDASIRVEKHWEEVLRKQALAREIRKKLKDLRNELLATRSELRIEETKHSEHEEYYRRSCSRFASTEDVSMYNATAHRVCKRQVQSLRSKVNNLNSQISVKENELKVAEKAPLPVFQPLPSTESAAMSILFFLYMPKIFQLLSRFSITSQQMLLPRPWTAKCGGSDGMESIDVFSQVSQTSLCQYSWTSYYNNYQVCTYHRPERARKGTDSDIYLRARANVVPAEYGPKHVDFYTSRSDGIWYPDALLPRMAWLGGPHEWDQHGHSDEFNPFLAQGSWSVSHFTELLPSDCISLQWAMHQPGSRSVCPSRGNRSLASQHCKPDWLSKQQYLSFCRLRAYPHTQLRLLTSALQERSLPFTHRAVHLVVYQLVYHVGDIGYSGEALFEWKEDLRQENLQQALLPVLRDYASELAESPKNSNAVRLVGDLCNFFSSWGATFRDISRQLASSVCKWADDIEGQIELSKPSETPLLRSRQVTFYSLAVLNLASGELKESDVSTIITLTTKARNLFVGDTKSKETEYLMACCDRAVLTQLPVVLAAVSQNPSFLTDAVQTVLQRCPRKLQWLPWNKTNGANTVCYEAHGADGCIYSINIVSGIVLVDGLPPSRLSLEVLSHPLYKRTFGNQNFEVVLKNGMHETVRPANGKFYRFYLCGSRLIVHEIGIEGSEELELLDGTNAHKWGAELPLRLQKLYSHWICRKHSVVILRDTLFNSRKTYFVIHLERNASIGGVSRATCKQMPRHSHKKDWLALANEPCPMDCIVLHNSPVVDILSKFEDQVFIHTLCAKIDGKESIKFELPRFGLTIILRDDELLCLEITGYKLADCQQLADSLRGFNRYLVLQHSKNKGDVMILVPCGKVVRNDVCHTRLEINQDLDAVHSWHRYEVHGRFRHIVAQNVTARLQLAALHFATSSQLPDKNLGMTGEERAVELVRQCWGTRPLSADETKKLKNLQSLCSGISPVLSLLCKDVNQSSQRVSFLHVGSTDEYHPVAMDCDEGSAYFNERKHRPCSWRRMLTPSEETRILGFCQDKHLSSSRLFQSTQEVGPCPISSNEVEEFQKSFDGMLKQTVTQASPGEKEYPLMHRRTGTKLELDMVQELKESWDAHCKFEHETNLEINGCTEAFTEQYIHIKTLRKVAEEYLLRALNVTPDGLNHWHGMGHSLLRTVNLVPTAKESDLARLACMPDLIMDFNPLLSADARGHLFIGLVTWLRLCVLEDKMFRIVSLASECVDRTKDIIDELLAKSSWDAALHPYWLVFEVEGNLQIRPDQHAVAQHLIDNPGDIIQLNMGLGKTRVILPMLVLHWSFGRRDGVTRLNFLSPLVTEAYEYLHNHLCASILGIKLYAMPFCRDVELNLVRAQTMQLLVDECKREGGAFVVTPEHRLSLELKQKELHRSNDLLLSGKLETFICRTPWRDILDESDELLHHRYQLIYAVGSVAALPGGGHRWRAAQSLLYLLAFDETVRVFFNKHKDIAIVLKEQMREAFPPFRLLSGPPLDAELPTLRGMLAKSLINNLPYELMWMKNHALQDQIYEALTEPQQYPAQLEMLSEDQLYDVLALRGFLAGNVLTHCLLKRHRVHYGVARPGKKRLAVPFRSADTPNERAEFAHPDCAIVLTALSYYSDGLTRTELREAVKVLLELGENAKKCFYNNWFKLSSERMRKDGSECHITLNSVDKIDLSNQTQQESMWEYYRRNVAAINFFLNFCVFPQEMEQYSKRLTATAWHLAHNPQGQVVGFSGTNDNHRILPLQVRQYFAPDDGDSVLRKLLSTNGKMLSVILNQTNGCIELPAGSPKKTLGELVNKQICSGKNIRAIIDAGALLAGVKNYDFAHTILESLPVDQFQGVVFFDNSTAVGEWLVLERSGRCIPRFQSPVREQDAFVLFDEPRCRGSDLKLRSDATAVLTLGPNMCKDKLMQAAGRMRMLERGQGLFIAGGSDVFIKLKALSKKRFLLAGRSVSAKDVLAWTIGNSVKSTAEGIPAWSNQGYFFATTFGKPTLSVQDEKLELKQFYGEPFVDDSVSKAANKAQKHHLQRIGGEASLNVSMRDMINKIQMLAERYGAEFLTSQRGVDEECERELELELELEEEIQEEVPQMCPVHEFDWEFSAVFNSASPSTLPVKTFTLVEVIKKRLLPPSLSKIKWPGEIHCTENFLQTVVDSLGNKEKSLNKYLRIADVFVQFSGGDLLLVSEREADALLKHFWRYPCRQKGRTLSANLFPRFLHHSFVRRSADNSSTDYLMLPNKGKHQVGDKALASIQLFSGETTYNTNLRKEAVADLIKGRKCDGDRVAITASTEPQHLVEMRGLLHLMPYSDLEKICTAVSREAARENSSS